MILFINYIFSIQAPVLCLHATITPSFLDVPYTCESSSHSLVLIAILVMQCLILAVLGILLIFVIRKKKSTFLLKLQKKQIHILAVINYAPRFRPNQTTQPTISRPFNSNPFGNKWFKRIMKFNKF